MTEVRPILVTGANGFVGGWLLRALEQHPDAPPVLATSLEGEGAFHRLDVTDRAAVEALVADNRPASVVHLAAQTFVPGAERDAARTYAVNLFGSLHLADALLAHAPDCRMLFVSSSEVYGASFRSRAEPLDETALLEPLNVYAASKAAADLAMGQYAHRGLDVVRLRPFNHFGPGQSGRFVIPSFVEQIVSIEAGEREPVIEVGNLASERDFLDVRDVVAAYVAALMRPQPLPRGAILNLASGVARPIGTILQTLTALSPAKIEVKVTAERMRRVEIPRAVGDARRAVDLLGWRPARAFDTSLAETLEAARVQRDPSRAPPRTSS